MVSRLALIARHDWTRQKQIGRERDTAMGWKAWPNRLLHSTECQNAIFYLYFASLPASQLVPQSSDCDPQTARLTMTWLSTFSLFSRTQSPPLLSSISPRIRIPLCICLFSFHVYAGTTIRSSGCQWRDRRKGSISTTDAATAESTACHHGN